MTNFTADATLEGRVVAKSVFVAEAEATEVLTNDALDDFRRETTVDRASFLGGASGFFVWCAPPRRP